MWIFCNLLNKFSKCQILSVPKSVWSIGIQHSNGWRSTELRALGFSAFENFQWIKKTCLKTRPNILKTNTIGPNKNNPKQKHKQKHILNLKKRQKKRILYFKCILVKFPSHWTQKGSKFLSTEDVPASFGRCSNTEDMKSFNNWEQGARHLEGSRNMTPTQTKHMEFHNQNPKESECDF